MPPITFHQLRIEDFKEIREIALKGWLFAYDYLPQRKLTKLVSNYYSSQKLKQALDNIRKGTDSFLVAKQDMKVIGFCHVGINPRKKAELYRLYIDLKYLGKGIGYRLLTKGEHFLKNKSCTKYFTLVNKYNNKGVNFYFKQGFVHIPRKDKFDEFKQYGKVLWYLEKRLSEQTKKKPF